MNSDVHVPNADLERRSICTIQRSYPRCTVVDQRHPDKANEPLGDKVLDRQSLHRMPVWKEGIQVYVLGVKHHAGAGFRDKPIMFEWGGQKLLVNLQQRLVITAITTNFCQKYIAKPMASIRAREVRNVGGIALAVFRAELEKLLACLDQRSPFPA